MGQQGGRRRQVARALSLITGVAGVGYVVWLLTDSVGDFEDGLVPGAAALGLAVFARVVGLAAASAGFTAVHERDDRSLRIAHGHALSQLTKYLPGGIWQPASQISVVAGGPTTVRRAATGYVWGMVVYVGVGALVATGNAVFPDPPLATPWRMVAATGLLVPLVLLPAVHRRMSAVMARIGRGPVADARPPSTTRLVSAFLAFGLSVVVDAAAYALLLRDLVPEVGFAAALAAFAAAWTLGVLAVPVPSGIGVREAVLVGALGAGGLESPVVAAALVVRVTAMVAELIFAGATTLGHYRHGRRQEAGQRSDDATSAGSRQ